MNDSTTHYYYHNGPVYMGGVSDYTHDIYYYKAFDFERPLFLFVWTPLICLTTLTNISIILVMSQKSMRTSTNMILLVIACNDSLTGLITIPLGYIYQSEGSSGTRNRIEMTEHVCKTFMILRYFLSRAFHTMSIWLTVLLAFQRMVLVRYPLKANRYLSMRSTWICIAGIIMVSPFIHIYHARGIHVDSVYNKQTLMYEYQCVWNLEEPCTQGCFYMWTVFHFMHFIPCTLLLMMAGLLVRSLFSSNTIKYTLSQRAVRRRETENRRVLSVVVAIVIVFLIPETMFGIYRLVEVSMHFTQALGGEPLALKTRRQLRISYEVLLVLSFHANFYIYLIMNRKFRHELLDLICCRVARARRRNQSFSSTGSGSRKRSRSTSLGGSILMKIQRRNTPNKQARPTKTLTCSGPGLDKSSTSEDRNETEAIVLEEN